MSTTYAIASAKGGVGKTTTVANIGTALAAAGEDVAVVDADVGMANLARTLGIDPDEATLHDVLAGTAALEDALYRGPEGVTALPGSEELTDYRSASLGNLDDVLATLEKDYDFVVVDTGAGLSHDAALPLEIVDEVLLVSTPQPQALGDTDKTRGLVERLGGTVAGLVLTRATSDATAERVGAEIVGRIPDDPAVDEAVIAGDPVVSFAPGSPAASAYRRLVTDVFGVDASEPEPEAELGIESDSGEASAAGGDMEADAAEGTVETGAAEGDEEADAEETVKPDAAEVEAAEADTDGEPTAADATDADATEGDGETDRETAETATVAEQSEAATDANETAAPDEAPSETTADSEETAGSDGSAEGEETTEPEEAAESGESDDADTDEETEAADAAEAIDAAEPADDKPASVGPRRTEDVPVSEAEPDTETTGEMESPLATTSEKSETKSKGFFRRLLGR